MDELIKQHQRLALEAACKDNTPKVWEEALSKPEMFDYILKNSHEVVKFLKNYNFPLPLVKKVGEVEEIALSGFLW